MNPYFDRDGITLYHGDSREVLPTLAAKSFDMVLTDPPYGVAYSTGYRRRVVRSSTQLQRDNQHLLEPLLNDTAAALEPLLNDTAVSYWFAAPERLDVVLPIIRRFWDTPNLLVWDKGNATAGDLETTYGQQWEAVIYGRKTRIPLVGGRDRDILRYSRGDTAQYHHPTQKPNTLLCYLIGRHKVSRIIDPFSGGGSTLVAARLMGIPAVGIEIDERYCEATAKRLAQGVIPGFITGTKMDVS